VKSDEARLLTLESKARAMICEGFLPGEFRNERELVDRPLSVSLWIRDKPNFIARSID
jgi:hypothetical protein